MVELPDTRGLICGFRLRENGTSEALNWDIASDPNRSFEGAEWLHFSLAEASHFGAVFDDFSKILSCSTEKG